MKIVCFDFDNVISDGNLISKLFKLRPEFRELELGLEFMVDNMNPKEFFTVMKKIVKLGKGLELDKIRKVMLGFGVIRGVRKTFTTLKKNGYKIVIVSAGDRSMIREFLKKNKLLAYVDHIYGSELGSRNNRLTGMIYGDVIRTEKTGAFKEIEKMYKAKKDDVVYVGDGLTDLPMMKLAGKSILFCPNVLTKIEAFRDKTLTKKEKNGKLFLIEKKDMTEILKFIS
jgi:HAD superfamily phosphoserine phosphatase-like hydrolase